MINLQFAVISLKFAVVDLHKVSLELAQSTVAISKRQNFIFSIRKMRFRSTFGQNSGFFVFLLGQKLRLEISLGRISTKFE